MPMQVHRTTYTVMRSVLFSTSGVESDMYECEMSRTIRLHRCQAKTTRFSPDPLQYPKRHLVLVVSRIDFSIRA